MRKNILIVEDSTAALARLKQIIGEIDKETQIHVAYNSSEAYQLALQYTIDVFLVDIVLDVKANADVSGIEFAQRIRNLDKYAFTPMIFTTSLADPKLYAFTNLHSFAYLEKPFSTEEVKSILIKALGYTTQRENDKKLYFRKEGLLFAVDILDIVYIENYFRKLNIRTEDEIMEMPYKSCKKLMEEIDAKDFLQCSRNTIINTKFIAAVDLANRYLILKEDYGRLEIGKAFIKSVKEHLQLEDI